MSADVRTAAHLRLLASLPFLALVSRNEGVLSLILMVKFALLQYKTPFVMPFSLDGVSTRSISPHYPRALRHRKLGSLSVVTPINPWMLMIFCAKSQSRCRTRGSTSICSGKPGQFVAVCRAVSARHTSQTQPSGVVACLLLASCL